jgi:hypothetical protein
MKHFFPIRSKPAAGAAKAAGATGTAGAAATYKITHSLISLAYTAVNGVIGVFLLFNFRNAVMTSVDRSSIRVFAINFIDISLSIILCIAWLIFVYAAQHLYEKDFMYSMVPKRFALFTSVQLILLGLIFCYVHIII